MNKIISNKFYEIEEEYRFRALKIYLRDIYSDTKNKKDFEWCRIPKTDNMQPLKNSGNIDLEKAFSQKKVKKNKDGYKITKLSKPSYSDDFNDLFYLRLTDDKIKGIDAFIISRKVFTEAMRLLEIKYRASLDYFIFKDKTTDTILLREKYFIKNMQDNKRSELLKKSLDALIKILCE